MLSRRSKERSIAQVNSHGGTKCTVKFDVFHRTDTGQMAGFPDGRIGIGLERLPLRDLPTR